MAKRKVGNQIGNLTPDHEKLGIDPCVQVACNMPLESSRRGLQLRFKLCPDRRSAQEVIVPQNCKTPSLGNFGTPIWESRDKKPFGCHCRQVVQSILYGGRWWLPRVRAVVSFVNSKSPVARPSTKGALTLC
jgi:hypothetical protein